MAGSALRVQSVVAGRIEAIFLPHRRWHLSCHLPATPQRNFPMAGPGIQQTQSLALQQTLAPQLQQSLQILQAPVLELRALIRQEMETNPLIEEAAPADLDVTNGAEESSAAADQEFREEFDRLAQLDEEYRDYLSASRGVSSRSADDDERRQFFFDSLVVEETLQSHLLNQLGTADVDGEERKRVELIVGNIDDQGYLQGSLSEMSASSGASEEDLERALKLVQTFHPAGVGARDLRECLMLQLERQGREQSLEYRIVSRHLDDLAKHRFPEIARRLGANVEQVQRAARSIARLDPKPGQVFSPNPNRYVLPEASVERVGEDYVIVLNNEQIPHLRISRAYRDLMANGTGPDVGNYIRDKIRSGKFLIKSIYQRQETIHNIVEQILKRQRDFFDFGPSHLKPMTMSQVAETVGVHETTVSRAISGKYLQTPHGVFEMKSFFTPGYATAEGGEISNTSVKNAIAELVKSEDARSPLSDKEIVDILAGRGLNIARRTVAKYRGELGILPSNMRRVY